jgi:hypothetical protein
MLAQAGFVDRGISLLQAFLLPAFIHRWVLQLYLITDLDLRFLAEGGNLGGHGCRETLERLPALP